MFFILLFFLLSFQRSIKKGKEKKGVNFYSRIPSSSSRLNSDAPHARPGDGARGRVAVVTAVQRRECGRNGDGKEDDTGRGDDDGGSSGDEATTANSTLRLQHLVLLRELQRPVAP